MDTIQLRPDGYLLDDLDYIEEQEAAAAIKVTPQTMSKYRKLLIGPRFSIVGRKILYSRSNLKTWLANGGTRAFIEHDAAREPRQIERAGARKPKPTG